LALDDITNAQALYQREVERCTSVVIREFQVFPELYLTESDLKCRLYKVLCNHPLFRRIEPTKDGRARTNYVHTETAYFVDGRLDKRRVDVTVVSPHNYDFSKREVVARKGYSFTEPSIGIELKFNKVKCPANMTKEVKEALDNLQMLRQYRYESKFYLFFLDRKVGFSEQTIDEWRNAYPNIKIIYSFMPWTTKTME
jgi:hypothetical protein